MGDDMNIRNEIKSIITKSGWTLTAVAQELDEQSGKSFTVQNLSQKLIRGTIKYQEILYIAEIIGYEIKWVKKETDD